MAIKYKIIIFLVLVLIIVLSLLFSFDFTSNDDKKEIKDYIINNLNGCNLEDKSICWFELEKNQITSSGECVLDDFSYNNYECNCFVDIACDECETCDCAGSSWHCKAII